MLHACKDFGKIKYYYLCNLSEFLNFKFVYSKIMHKKIKFIVQIVNNIKLTQYLTCVLKT